MECAFRDQRSRFCGVIFCLLVAWPFVASAKDDSPAYPPAAEVRQAFLKLLDRPREPLDVQFADEPEERDGLVTERLSIASEKKADGTVERVPILLVRPAKSDGKAPAVIVLHGTGGNKEGQADWLVRLAKQGMIGVAIDARYHGERPGAGAGSEAYIAAITKAWRAKPGEPQEHPFYYDTAWDLWRLVDYLSEREDVDAKRLGMLGFSMGGIQTWLAASVDERIRAAVPAISVQSFRWSLDNNQWQGRARTIRAAHDAAASDLIQSEVTADVCRALWNKVIPGMLDRFDCPSMLRLFAGRPLFIVSGDEDPNCPVGGAKLAIASAREAYQAAGAEKLLKIDLARGVGHQVTPSQQKLIMEWLSEQLQEK